MIRQKPLTNLKQKQSHDWHGGQCRLLYLVGQLRLGGLERQLYYLLANLDHDRYRPAVVVWNLDPSEKYYKEIEALKIPITGFASTWSPFYKLQAFRTLTRKAAPDVIHSYGFHTNFAAHYAARGTAALAIGSLRSDFINAKKDGGIIRGVLNARWPAYIVSNSLACAEAARQVSGLFAPKRLLVVRNGLDLKSFVCPKDVSVQKTYVAAVGSLFQIKRWDRLLRVIQMLKAAGVGELDFRIAGDGPLRSSLEIMARDLGISSCINFLGESHDIPGFLRDAKFLVHTSESEGYPNVVMEAMACGLPVVAMSAGDIPYLVEDGKTGFVVRQGDEKTFGERLLQLLLNNELCIRMGLCARTRAERDFGVDRLVAETLAAYRAAGWKDEGMKD